MINQGVHVAGCHAEIQTGLTQRLEGRHRLPIRLGDNPDSKAVRLQYAADHCHTKTWVINIGVAGHYNHIALIPTKGIHFGPRGR